MKKNHKQIIYGFENMTHTDNKITIVRTNSNYNQVNDMNIWFAKVIIILIRMAQKDSHFTAAEKFPRSVFDALED